MGDLLLNLPNVLFTTSTVVFTHRSTSARGECRKSIEEEQLALHRAMISSGKRSRRSPGGETVDL